jgi:alkanesulfonate monooxygenase SsuD/methylene tetrahydromethanopterin reductase-like flavin-dependent oxidoreductase (luciferase family)
MSRGRVGIQVAASTPPDELAAICAEVERLGYAELWLAEDYFELGGIASAAVALAATKTIPVGLGVLSDRVRHPAVTAMELATLGGAYPGRFMAGLGHGVPSWVGQMGLSPASLIRSLREGAGAVHRLLDGQELSEAGEYATFERVRLLHPPPQVPVYLGVHGPRSLELSGELAEGTLLGWFSSPDYVRWARLRIQEGRARAGRADPHGVVALLVTSVSEADPDRARAALRPWASDSLLASAGQPEMLATEAGEALALAARQRGSGSEALPDPLLATFMAAGGLDDGARSIGRLLDAGADRVVLVPNPAGQLTTAAMVEQIRIAANLLG